MQVFNAILKDREDGVGRVYVDIVAVDIDAALDEIKFNWKEHKISSISPTAGDIVVVAGGKIEMFECNEPKLPWTTLKITPRFEKEIKTDE